MDFSSRLCPPQLIWVYTPSNLSCCAFLMTAFALYHFVITFYHKIGIEVRFHLIKTSPSWIHVNPCRIAQMLPSLLSDIRLHCRLISRSCICACPPTSFNSLIFSGSLRDFYGFDINNLFCSLEKFQMVLIAVHLFNEIVGTK